MHDTIKTLLRYFGCTWRRVAIKYAWSNFVSILFLPHDLAILPRAMEQQGDGPMEFGENDVFIAMEEGDLDGEELEDLGDADPAGTSNTNTCTCTYFDTVVDEDDDAGAQLDGDAMMEPPADHAQLQCKEHQGATVPRLDTTYKSPASS